MMKCISFIMLMCLCLFAPVRLYGQATGETVNTLGDYQMKLSAHRQSILKLAKSIPKEDKMAFVALTYISLEAEAHVNYLTTLLTAIQAIPGETEKEMMISLTKEHLQGAMLVMQSSVEEINALVFKPQKESLYSVASDLKNDLFTLRLTLQYVHDGL